MKNGIKISRNAFLLACLLLMSSLPEVQANLLKEGRNYQNTNDFVCGYQSEDDDTVTRHDMYISFYNPNEFPVMLNNFFNLTNQEGAQEPEFAERYLNVIISPKRDFAIDCGYINNLFYPDIEETAGHPRSFSTYMHSKSMRYLEIVIEYSRQSKFKSAMLAETEAERLGRGESIID